MCHVLCAMCELPCVMCHVPGVRVPAWAARQAGHAMCYVPCVNCHVSCATCQVSEYLYERGAKLATLELEGNHLKAALLIKTLTNDNT